MRRIVALVAALACAQTAAAQSAAFLGGDLFADLKRFSDAPNTPGLFNGSSGTALDGNAVGGGVRAGVLVGNRWSVSAGVDFGASTTRQSAGVPIPLRFQLGNVIPPAGGSLVAYPFRTSNRLVATSVLLGYHGAAAHRVRPGVFGGLTFMHVTRRYEGGYPLAYGIIQGSPSGGQAAPIPCCYPCCSIRPPDQVDNVPAATVGAEAALELGRHIAAVPEVRAHVFSLSNGGPSAFAIRPGIGIRWMF